MTSRLTLEKARKHKPIITPVFVLHAFDAVEGRTLPVVNDIGQPPADEDVAKSDKDVAA